MSFARLTPEEAAALVEHDTLVGFSGFTPAGAAKLVPRALAARARQLHEAGTPFKVRAITGASTGPDIDEALASADALSWRAPYQSSKAIRDRVNAGGLAFVDMHLSHVPQALLEGFFGEVDLAVVECCEATSDGRVYLTTSIGLSPTLLTKARRVVLEVNRRHPVALAEMADIVILPPPPFRVPIGINDPLERIGETYVQVDPAKIVGVVEHAATDGIAGFNLPTAASTAIAGHVVEFLTRELASGRLPAEGLPLQAGVGNVANAVMAGIGAAEVIPPFTMFTEVFQDSLVDLMLAGRLRGASTTALTLSEPQLDRVYEHLDYFTPRLVLRPQEISNNPGVIRRLGVISLNTALEVDIYGHVNSTHVGGTALMNGVGGSGDFTRNSFVSIFMCPSVAKGGRISAIVPMASHVDHNEHSVQVVVTEQGLADLRGLAPSARAEAIIERCAHPDYRPYLRDYVARAPQGHLRHDLSRAFELHVNLARTGWMLQRDTPGTP
jgi:succinate CoA transferase